jgi:hypothetical protein
MSTAEEIENAQKGIKSFLQEPLCEILLKKSFFTEIQLETLLIDHMIGESVDQRVTQEKKAKARRVSKGRSRGAYNRVLQQSRKKLEKTLYSILLMGYLGILADVRISTLSEASEKLQDYINSVRSRQTSPRPSSKGGERVENEAIIEKILRRELYDLLVGDNAQT